MLTRTFAPSCADCGNPTRSSATICAAVCASAVSDARRRCPNHCTACSNWPRPSLACAGLCGSGEAAPAYTGAPANGERTAAGATPAGDDGCEGESDGTAAVRPGRCGGGEGDSPIATSAHAAASAKKRWTVNSFIDGRPGGAARVDARRGRRWDRSRRNRRSASQLERRVGDRLSRRLEH
ncbi:hypothetical protein J5226_06635 [Lysobacter sp. K5869]|uniref:hypothetical protein n=1 Tax=Lysobacter sp. K5869 TaxID=2820808 RepID=UPI001C05F09C|nr:hypothetical protein [Lysobacter sp. K5869]QWP78067.1 hypothetical protein J5226_06635 [Lysobacter sp. K5869]